jgi:hypothetical protein
MKSYGIYNEKKTHFLHYTYTPDDLLYGINHLFILHLG